jgi:hypothetical protein
MTYERLKKLANVHLDHLVDTDLDVMRLLKPNDEFPLRQLRVLYLMLAKSNADNIRHCSVVCSM